MKKIILVITVILSVGMSSSILAGPKKHSSHRGGYIDHAKVIHVQPIYETVRVSIPEQQCWNENVQRPVKRVVRNGSPENAVIGGIIGGIIGHELGDGRSKPVATVAGAIIGSAIARDAHYQTTGYRVEQQTYCKTEHRVSTEQQIVGYHVQYRYKGDVYSTRMRNHPGKMIQVKVEVVPVNTY